MHLGAFTQYSLPGVVAACVACHDAALVPLDADGDSGDGALSTDIGPADGLETDELPPGGLRLLAMQPSEVPLHGVAVEFSYEGELPTRRVDDEPLEITLTINGGVFDTPLAHVTASSFGLTMPAAALEGPIAVEVLADNESSAVLARLDPAGSCVALPASPRTELDAETLVIPLHPELRGTCRRSGWVRVYNDGDHPITITEAAVYDVGALACNPRPCSFALGESTCEFPIESEYGLACSFQVCFEPHVESEGTHTGVVSISIQWSEGGVTNNTVVSAALWPQTPGLDGPSEELEPYCCPKPIMALVRSRLSSLGNGAVVVSLTPAWDGRLFHVSPTGIVTTWLPIPDSGRQMSAARDGSGLYVLARALTAVARIQNDGAIDQSFGVDGFASVRDRPGAIEVQSYGRILLFAHTERDQADVRALTAVGEVDESYRDDGVVMLAEPGNAIPAHTVSADPGVLDSQDRLYVYLHTDEIVRLLPEGQVDESFSLSSARVDAMALNHEDQLLVASEGIVRVFDEESASTNLIEYDSRPAVDLDVTPDGRFYLTTDAGRVRMFDPDGRSLGDVGFDGARRVACTTASGCYITGTTPGPGAGNELWPPYGELYVLRLMP